MGTFFYYLLQSGFCLLLFYAFFRWVLGRTTFFRFNRIVLLAGILGSVLLPLVEIPVAARPDSPSPFVYLHEVLQETVAPGVAPTWADEATGNADSNGTPPAACTEQATGRWMLPVLGIIYLLGCLSVCGALLISFFRMRQLIRKSTRMREPGYTLALTSQPVGSFSWGRYIVMNEADHRLHPDEVLLHETMHIRHRHTWDLVFMQLFLVLYWFNPAIWLLKRELQELHEYEADEAVLRTGVDATRYQLLLVRKAVGTRLYSMANGFNHSKLKNRIGMMLKERTHRWERWKLLLFVPVAAGTLYAFAQPEVSENSVRSGGYVASRKEPQQGDVEEQLRMQMQMYYSIGRSQALREQRPYKPEEMPQLSLHISADGRLSFQGKLVNEAAWRAQFMKTVQTARLQAYNDYKKDKAVMVITRWDEGASFSKVQSILEFLKETADKLKPSNFPVWSKSDPDKEFVMVVDAKPISSIRENNNDRQKKITGLELSIYRGNKRLSVLKDFSLADLEKERTRWRQGGIESNELVFAMKCEKDSPREEMDVVKRFLRTITFLPQCTQEIE